LTDSTSIDATRTLGRTCMVTGGAGYLGQRLVRALLDRGYEVHVFDRARAAFDDPRVAVFEGDIVDYESVRRAMEGCETVFHAAALIDLVGLPSRARRKRSFDVNVEGTRNILRACEASGVHRLVYTSSNNVVFDWGFNAGDETMPYAREFIDLYTETKVVAEKDVEVHFEPVLPVDKERRIAELAQLRDLGVLGAGQIADIAEEEGIVPRIRG